LQPVDGGVNYYAQFTNGPSTAPFPIGVWLACANDATAVQNDKEIGINLYVGLCANAPELANVKNANLRVFPQSEWLSRGVSFGAETSGWMNSDELDMTQGPAGCQTVQSRNSLFPADGRLRYANYGKGVAFWQTDAQAACFVNTVHLPSLDVYWFTDPFVCGISEGGRLFTGGSRALTQAECRRASNYGATTNRVRNLISPLGSKPMWNFVELGWPFTEAASQGGRTISPAEVRAGVWHSLIAGARGIIYFNHSFGGSCITQNVLRSSCGGDPAIRTMVTSVNAQIQSIAGALNGPRLTSGFSASSTMRAAAKWDGQNLYVMAGSAENGGPFQSTFSIPCVGNATATVLGETRTIPVSAGSFSDSFADGNAVHIYRIDGGSTCGLTLGDVEAAQQLLAPSPFYGLHAIGRLIPDRASPELSE
jgi:hypothetical protein